MRTPRYGPSLINTWDEQDQILIAFVRYLHCNGEQTGRIRRDKWRRDRPREFSPSLSDLCKDQSSKQLSSRVSSTYRMMRFIAEPFVFCGLNMILILDSICGLQRLYTDFSHVYIYGATVSLSLRCTTTAFFPSWLLSFLLSRCRSHGLSIRWLDFPPWIIVSREREQAKQRKTIKWSWRSFVLSIADSLAMCLFSSVGHSLWHFCIALTPLGRERSWSMPRLHSCPADRTSVDRSLFFPSSHSHPQDSLSHDLLY